MVQLEQIRPLLEKAGIEDQVVGLETLPGEASSRSYCRLRLAQPFRGQRSIILCTGLPQPYLDDDHFIELSCFLREHSIPTPEVLAVEESKGQLLLSDAGEEDLCAHFLKLQRRGAHQEMRALVFQAIDLILAMQSLKPPELVSARKFDRAKLSYEMDFFLDNLKVACDKCKIEYPITHEFRLFLEELCGLLGKKENASVFVHRDYHSRNIMISTERIQKTGLCLLDFQDARMGRRVYDLVSLLYDPYLSLSQGLRTAGLDYFFNHSIGEAKTEYYFRQALQRLLKALGTYIHQVFQKKQTGYLETIPKAIELGCEVVREGLFPDPCFIVLEKLRYDFYPAFREQILGDSSSQ